MQGLAQSGHEQLAVIERLYIILLDALHHFGELKFRFRLADAELASMRGDGERQHAVEPHHRERERGGSEEVQQPHEDLLFGERLRHSVIHGADVVHGDLRVQPSHDPHDRGSECGGVGFRRPVVARVSAASC